MKKILLMVCCLFLIFSISACEFTSGSSSDGSYKLTYYDEDGTVLNLLPSTYTANAHVKLPQAPEKEGYTFEGWLINNKGDTYNEFDGKVGSLKLYASYTANDPSNPPVNPPDDPIEPTVTYENPYAKVLKTNYSFQYNYVTYIEYNGISHIASEDYDMYFKAETDGTYSKYSYDELEECYVKSTITDSQRQSALFAAGFLNFKGLDTQFVKENNALTNTTSANTIGRTLFNNNENYKSVVVTITNNIVSTIVVTLEDDTTITISMFKNTNEIDISYLEGEEPDSNIFEALQADDGETFTVTGYVTGTVGYNFYISDGWFGMYIYPNVSTYRDIVKEGETLTISGKMTTYNGLRELGNITNVVKATKPYEVWDVYTLDDFENIDAYLYLPVNLSNFTVVQAPTVESGFKTGSKDVKLQITDGKDTYTVLFHKNLTTAVKTELYDILTGLEAGSKVSLDNVIVSYYNGVQFAFTNEATLTDITTYEEQLILSNTSVSSTTGKTLSELLKNMTFKKQETDGTFTSLSIDDLTFSAYDSSLLGNQVITVTYGSLTATINVYLYEAGTVYRPTDVEVLDDVLPNMGVEDGITYGITAGLPNTGEPKVLVIPITFTDYGAPNGMVETLQKAFFGTSEDTGWESLQSYYLKSSFGKLNITGTVLQPYNTGHKASYYKSYNDEDAVNMIIHDALSYYDATIDYSEYDTDGDGYIDGLYLVYTCPVDYDSDTVYWAFTYEYYTDDYEYYDEVEADYYCWLGMDFLEEELANGTYIEINCETIIHETGHLIGLDDYYDYDTSKGPDGGLGGSDMMDYNVGDHNTYSKSILGWVNPYVVNGYDASVTIGKANATGDAIIVCNTWNNTYFDEYLLIEYYTPDGLNALEAGYQGLFTIGGIKIYHIDAKTNDPTLVWDQWSLTKSNNSDTTNKVICYIEADGNDDIRIRNAYSSNSDLFQAGDTYTLAKWYTKQVAGITITIEEVGETATISITFNN